MLFSLHRRIAFEDAYPQYLLELDIRDVTFTMYGLDFERVYLPYFAGKYLHKISQDDIARFLVSRKDVFKNCRRTRKKHLSALRAFFKWARRRGYRCGDPTAGFTVRVGTRKFGIALEPEDARELLSATLISQAKYLFQAALTFFMTGLRNKNVLGQRWLELDLKRRMMSIDGEEMKGDADHALPINHQLAEYLERLYEKRQPEPEDYVLGVRMKRVRTSFKTALRRAGLPAKIRIHDLRHTWATWLEEIGGVQCANQLLAHAPPKDVTFKYIHLPWRRKVEIIESLPIIIPPGEDLPV